MAGDINRMTWHPECLTAATRTALLSLRDASVLEPFYLAGGTGLALWLGHRLSRDLDFFTGTKFDEEQLLGQISALAGFSLTANSAQTLHAVVNETKVSFFSYVYPLLFPAAEYVEVAIADVRDIACMKISAIAGRGARRDFVDLYAAAQRVPLSELLRMFETKYAQARYSKAHILKSLTFFEDAEKDPLPQMVAGPDWGEVKRYFVTEVPRLLRA